jgi:hypothetical protein
VDTEPFPTPSIHVLFGDAKQVIGAVVEEPSKLPAEEVLAA